MCTPADQPAARDRRRALLLQALASVVFGIDYRNLGVQMPSLSVGEMQFSSARLLTFVAVVAIVGTGCSEGSYLGTASGVARTAR